MRKATTALTEDESRKNWREFQRLVTEDLAHIWLASGRALFAIRKGVKGVIPYPQPGFVSLEKAYIELSLKGNKAQELADDLFEGIDPKYSISAAAAVWTGKEWDVAVKNLHEKAIK